MKKFTNNTAPNAQYSVYYNNNCKSIDFQSFQKVKRTVQQHILDDKCPAEMKVMFGEYFFTKIWQLYKLPEKDKDKIIPKITDAIEVVQNIVSKGEYLKFLDEEALRIISEHFYIERFNAKYFVLQMINDTQLLKRSILNPKFTDEELCQHFVSWINRTKLFEQKSNLLDVILRYFPKNKEVLDIYDDMKFGGKKNKSLYSNAQNAHHNDVKDSTLKSAFALLCWDEEVGSLEIPPMTTFRCYAEWILENVPLKKGDADKVKCVVERMCIDTTYFSYQEDKDGGKSKTFSISEIFLAVANYIGKSAHKKDLKIILMEEIREMADLCSSGYISRFISILSGYDDRFAITVSPLVQLNAVVSNRIQMSLENASEEVILASLEEDKTLFMDFIDVVVRKHMDDWCKDYGKEFVVENVWKVVSEVVGIEIKRKDDL